MSVMKTNHNHSNEGFPDFSFKDYKRKGSMFNDMVTFADLNSRINELETRKNSTDNGSSNINAPMDPHLYSKRKISKGIQSEQVNKINQRTKRGVKTQNVSEIRNYTDEGWREQKKIQKEFFRHPTFGKKKLPDSLCESESEKGKGKGRGIGSQKEQPENQLIEEAFTDPIEEQQSSFNQRDQFKHMGSREDPQQPKDWGRNKTNAKNKRRGEKETKVNSSSKKYTRFHVEKFVSKEPVNNIYTQRIEHYNLPGTSSRSGVGEGSTRGSLYKPKRLSGPRFSNLSGFQMELLSNERDFKVTEKEIGGQFEKKRNSRDMKRPSIFKQKEELVRVMEDTEIRDSDILSDHTLKSQKIIHPVTDIAEDQSEIKMKRKNTQKKTLQSRSTSPSKPPRLVTSRDYIGRHMENGAKYSSVTSRNGERETRGGTRKDRSQNDKRKRSLYTGNLKVLNPGKRKKKKQKSLNVYNDRANRMVMNFKRELLKEYKNQYKSSDREPNKKGIFNICLNKIRESKRTF